MDIDTAIPYLLLGNERLSKVLKPTFPNGCFETIGVETCCWDEGEYRLKVRYERVGMQAGMDYRNTTSLGLQLVNSLSQQHGGDENNFRASVRHRDPNCSVSEGIDHGIAHPAITLSQ